jgi:hypothetical protein
MFEIKGFDFSSIDQIFHLNSMPTTGGNLYATDSAAQAISRFKCLTATALSEEPFPQPL